MTDKKKRKKVANDAVNQGQTSSCIQYRHPEETGEHVRDRTHFISVNISLSKNCLLQVLFSITRF